VFRQKKSAEQMDIGIWSYITRIDQRRLIAADEERAGRPYTICA
jgi:hypothetical protein